MAKRKVRRIHHKTLKGHPSIRGIIKLSLIFILIQIAYLIVLPIIMTRIVPCLGNHPFDSYTSAECTVEGALDQFMRLALIGLSLLTVVFLGVLKGYLKIAPFHDVKTWLKIPSQKMFILEFAPLVITTLIMASCIVVFYFLFIPTAENAVRNAPIILDSVTQPTK